MYGTSKYFAALSLLAVMAGGNSAQTLVENDLPKPGATAPALSFTRLLQVPAGTNVDWPSLKGKVVILEFWATWCAPCLAEIPVLNSLAAIDPSKVQVLSIDDEDPAVVEAFLKKKPVSGFLGIDTSGEVFKRFGVNARPTTIVVDTRGTIVSTDVTPQQMKPDQLLDLSAGKPVKLGGEVDPAVQAAISEAMAKEFEQQAAPHGTTAMKPLFEISLTAAEPAKDGAMPMTHIMRGKSGKLDITNATVPTLLSNGAGARRIKETSKLPATLYNLHVEAPQAEPKLLAESVESAIAMGTGLHIEHQSKIVDAYILTATAASKEHFKDSKSSGGAWVDPDGKLHCLSSASDNLAGALEDYLGSPVIDETGLSGKLTTTFNLGSRDLAAVNAALGKELGVTLVTAKRPVETVVIYSPVK